MSLGALRRRRDSRRKKRMDPAHKVLLYLPANCRPVLVIAGGILLHLTLGTIYTFGNTLPYVVSYLRNRVDSSQTHGSMIWLQTLMSGVPFAMVAGGFLEKKLGPRRSALCGCALVTTGTALSFFTIQTSYYLLLLTYGLMFGVGQAVAYISVLVCAQKWLPDRVGLASGLIVAGFGCGAFIFSPIQTKFVNPHNYSPDRHGYFNQTDLLDRVPYLFLLLAVLYATFQLLGLLFLVNPTKDEVTTRRDDIERESLLVPVAVDEELEEEEITLHQALRSSTFWWLFTSLLCNGIWVQITSAFYKTFGQTLISDDFFLAAVGSAASVCNAVSRVVWGTVVDHCGYQTSMAISSTCSAALMWTLVYAGQIGKIPYIFWICCMYFCVGGTYSLLPYATNKCFGHHHFGVNYGMVQLSLSLSGILAALMSQFLLPIIHFNGLFLLTGGIAYITFLLTVTLHRTPHGRKRSLTKAQEYME